MISWLRKPYLWSKKFDHLTISASHVRTDDNNSLGQPCRVGLSQRRPWRHAGEQRRPSPSKAGQALSPGRSLSCFHRIRPEPTCRLPRRSRRRWLSTERSRVPFKTLPSRRPPTLRPTCWTAPGPLVRKTTSYLVWTQGIDHRWKQKNTWRVKMRYSFH
jgi:hypothetical protein